MKCCCHGKNKPHTLGDVFSCKFSLSKCRGFEARTD